MIRSLSACLLVYFPLLANGIQYGDPQGWSFYNEKEEEVREVPRRVHQDHQAYTDTQKVEVIKKELEETKAKALLKPTEENVYNYMKVQKEQIDRASKFSETWEKVLIKHPELNAAIENPTNQLGSSLKKAVKEQAEEEFFHSNKDKFGLFYFYEGNHIESFAEYQVLHLFQEKYNWQILPISKDGVFFEGIEQIYEPKVIERVGVKVFPAIYLIQDGKEEAQPVGHGVLTLNEIKRNIVTVAKQGRGKND